MQETGAVDNLKYFGYFGLSGYLGQSHPDYVKEVEQMGNTNIAISIAATLKDYYEYHGRLLYFPSELVNIDPTKYNLYPDWRSKWQLMVDNIKGREDKIYGFIFDEPVWNNISKSEFLEVTRKMRETFPNMAILVIEAYKPIIDGTIPADYYSYVTDIGFDYYLTNENGDNVSGWNYYMTIFNKFKPFVGNKNIGWCLMDFVLTEYLTVLVT